MPELRLHPPGLASEFRDAVSRFFPIDHPATDIDTAVGSMQSAVLQWLNVANFGSDGDPLAEAIPMFASAIVAAGGSFPLDGQVKTFIARLAYLMYPLARQDSETYGQLLRKLSLVAGTT